MTDKRKGFTLVETVISVALMGLVIVTVLGVFVAGNNAIKKGRCRIAGINLAEKKITEVRNLLATYKDPNTNIRPYIEPNAISGTINDIKPAGNILLWKVPTTTMAIYGIENISTTGDYEFEIELADYFSSTSYTTIPDIKLVTVTIYWIDPVSGRLMITKMSNLITRE